MEREVELTCEAIMLLIKNIKMHCSSKKSKKKRKSLLLELRESHRKGYTKIVRATQMEETRRTRPPDSTEQVTYELTETEVASAGPTLVCIRSSVYILWVIVLIFLFDSDHEKK